MLLENCYPSSICSIEDKVIEAKEMEAGLSPGNFEFNQTEKKENRNLRKPTLSKTRKQNTLLFSMISLLRASLTAMIF
jgi:hypothetical protein